MAHQIRVRNGKRRPANRSPDWIYHFYNRSGPEQQIPPARAALGVGMTRLWGWRGRKSQVRGDRGIPPFEERKVGHRRSGVVTGRGVPLLCHPERREAQAERSRRACPERSRRDPAPREVTTNDADFSTTAPGKDCECKYLAPRVPSGFLLASPTLGVGMTRLWDGVVENPKCAATVKSHLSKDERWGARGPGSSKTA
jgi:hypothetical protein